MYLTLPLTTGDRSSDFSWDTKRLRLTLFSLFLIELLDEFLDSSSSLFVLCLYSEMLCLFCYKSVLFTLKSLLCFIILIRRWRHFSLVLYVSFLQNWFIRFSFGINTQLVEVRPSFTCFSPQEMKAYFSVYLAYTNHLLKNLQNLLLLITICLMFLLFSSLWYLLALLC